VTDRKLWDRRLDTAERHPFLSFLYWAGGITVVILCLVAIVGLATTGSVFFKSAASNSTLKSRVNIQRNSTDNAVASISFFHDTCNDVNRQLSIYAVNHDKFTRLSKRPTASDPLQAQRQTDALNNADQDATGALNVAIVGANDYNAKAANSLNAKFREAGLPERININPSSPPTSIDCG
jgi:hypothetical protein